MNLSQNLDFLRGLDKPSLPANVSNSVKDYTEIADTLDNDIEMLKSFDPSYESDVKQLVDKLKSMGIKPKAKGSAKGKATKARAEKAKAAKGESRTNATNKTAKKRAENKTKVETKPEKVKVDRKKSEPKAPRTPRPPKEKKPSAKEVKLEKLRKENEVNFKLVKENAKFKDKIANEMATYLKSAGISIAPKGMAGLSIDEQLKEVEAKNKFYKNLLAGDVADFKSIAKRIGLDYRTVKPTKTPKELAKPSDGMNGTKAKSKSKDSTKVKSAKKAEKKTEKPAKKGFFGRIGDSLRDIF